MQEHQPARRRDRLRRAAVYYAREHGWPVFPLAPRRKVPLIPRRHGGRGCLDATTDLNQIAAWWAQCPEANIGLALGEPCGGIFALDVDPRNAGDRWRVWEEFGPIPETVEAFTGGGGVHILLKGPAENGRLMLGVDVKSTGGYIVLPPSIHPSGTLYTWEASSGPHQLTIAPAPNEILQAVQHKPRSRHEHQVTVDPHSFVLGNAFLAAGWLGEQVRPGVWSVLCPNRDQHTTGRDFNSSTVIFAPARPGGRGRFFCSHSHCLELR